MFDNMYQEKMPLTNKHYIVSFKTYADKNNIIRNNINSWKFIGEKDEN